MELCNKKIVHLPVFTRAGKELGKVSSFDIDLETQRVSRFYVKSNHLIAELFSKELIIAASQVISITEEKMVVEDLHLKEKEGVVNKDRLLKDNAAPPVSFSKM